MKRLFLALVVLMCSVVAAWGAPPEIILESAIYTETSQDVDFEAIAPYKNMLLTFIFNTTENAIFLDVNIETGARTDARTVTITGIGELRHGMQFELMSLEEGSITLTARNSAGESSTFTRHIKAIEWTPPENTNYIKVELIPSEIRLEVGDQIRVTASGDPEITIFNEATWEIEDTTIATVDSDFPHIAYVRGHSNGETTLKYTVHDRFTDAYGTTTAKVIVRTTPATPATPNTPATPSTPTTPDSTVTPNTPETPNTPDTPTPPTPDNPVTPQTPDRKEDTGGSGGGCNAGFLGLAVLAALAMKKM